MRNVIDINYESIWLLQWWKLGSPPSTSSNRCLSAHRRQIDFKKIIFWLRDSELPGPWDLTLFLSTIASMQQSPLSAWSEAWTVLINFLRITEDHTLHHQKTYWTKCQFIFSLFNEQRKWPLMVRNLGSILSTFSWTFLVYHLASRSSISFKEAKLLKKDWWEIFWRDCIWEV